MKLMRQCGKLTKVFASFFKNKFFFEKKNQKTFAHKIRAWQQP
jgi:hypothetical protein